MNSIWAVLRQRWITRSAVPGVSPLPIRALPIGSADRVSLAADGGGAGRSETAGAESGSAVSIHGPLYSAASGVEADGCGQVAGATALYRLRLEIRFWVGIVLVGSV